MRLCENESDIKVVQDVMGHKNSRTTMDVYNEATAARKAASFRALRVKSSRVGFSTNFCRGHLF